MFRFTQRVQGRSTDNQRWPRRRENVSYPRCTSCASAGNTHRLSHDISLSPANGSEAGPTMVDLTPLGARTLRRRRGWRRLRARRGRCTAGHLILLIVIFRRNTIAVWMCFAIRHAKNLWASHCLLCIQNTAEDENVAVGRAESLPPGSLSRVRRSQLLSAAVHWRWRRKPSVGLDDDTATPAEKSRPHWLLNTGRRNASVTSTCMSDNNSQPLAHTWPRWFTCMPPPATPCGAQRRRARGGGGGVGYRPPRKQARTQSNGANHAHS